MGACNPMLCLFPGGLFSRFVKQSNARSRTHTFDANRFLEDVHELPSPKLSAEEKLHWMGYLWRFYDLNEIVDPHR